MSNASTQLVPFPLFADLRRTLVGLHYRCHCSTYYNQYISRIKYRVLLQGTPGSQGPSGRDGKPGEPVSL